MESRKSTYRSILIASILLSVISLCAFSFSQIDDQKEVVEVVKKKTPDLVQKEVERKLEKFKLSIIKRCTENAIKNAEIFIDSLVADELELQRNDTIAFPAKPTRPVQPGKIILNDSTGISPILYN